MKQIKRIVCLLLAVCMIAGMLTGCKKSQRAEVVLHPYKVETLNDGLTDLMDNVNSSCIQGDSLYLLGYNYDENWNESCLLLRCGLDGSDPVFVDFETRKYEGENGYAGVDRMMADGSGGLYILQHVSSWGTEENDWMEENTYYLDKVDPATGAILNSVEFGQPDENTWLSTYNATMDKDGTLLIPADNKLVMIRPDGQTKMVEVSSGGYINTLFRQADGSVIAQYYDSDYKLHVAPFDVNTGKMGEDMTLPAMLENSSLNYVDDGAGKLYGYNDAGIYSVDFTAGTSELLCSWLDSDVDYSNGVQNVVPRSDGTFVVIGMDENYENMQVNLLSYVDPSTLPEKTVLTLATLYSAWDMRRAAIKFNRASDTTRITIIDYSVYNSEENEWRGGVEKMNNDIISGQVPDLLEINSEMNFDNYVSKGLFTDLYPLLDADTDISREDLLPNVLRACETDGKLTSLLTGFYVYTMIGKTSVVGEKRGWTWDEFNAMLAKHPDVQYAIPNAARSELLHVFVALNHREYIDDDTGKCSFDSPEFIKLLEYVAAYPEEYPDYQDERLLFAEDKALVMFNSMYDVSSVRDIGYYLGSTDFEYTYKGFPTADGEGGSAIMGDGRLAISEACPDKNAAWDFLSFFLTEDYQMNGIYSFPVLKAALEQRIEREMDPELHHPGIYADPGIAIDEDIMPEDVPVDEEAVTEEPADEVSAGETPADEVPADDEVVEGVEEPVEVEVIEEPAIENYDEYWNRPLSEKEVQNLRELLASADTLYHYDEEVNSIIAEEVTDFFNGIKSAAEVAGLIQQRVQTYISESR